MFARSIGFCLLALCMAPSSVKAQTYATERGTVEFTSRVPLHTFTGTSTRLTGEINLETKEIDFFVDLESLQTGIGRRDRDMRETLETDRYPFAEFTGQLQITFDPASSSAQRATARGTFTIHGVSRTITVAGALQKTGSQIRLIADWEIRLEDYNITPPRLLLVRVNQVQVLHINALLSRR